MLCENGNSELKRKILISLQRAGGGGDGGWRKEGLELWDKSLMLN